MNSRIIRCFEHKAIRVGNPDCFKEAHFRALIRFNENHGSKYFTVGDRSIRFSSYVGVIQVGNLTVEILPKADVLSGERAELKWQRALLEMLHTCRLIKIDSLSKTVLRLERRSLLDIYIESFILSLEGILAGGLIKRYRTHRANLSCLRGKIDSPGT